MTFWPSTLPPDPLFDAITARVLAAAADRTDKEWKGMSDKPSGVAAAQAAATDIGLAIQTVEGFPTKQLQWERWESFYVYQDCTDGRWYVGDRRKPVGNPFHFVARCETEDEAIRACLQWNRGPQPPTG